MLVYIYNWGVGQLREQKQAELNKRVAAKILWKRENEESIFSFGGPCHLLVWYGR